MKRFVLERTGKESVAFHGERILFETVDVACSHFELHGYVSLTPVNCYVLAIRERRLCSDTRDVCVFDDKEHFEKALTAGVGTLELFKIAHATTPLIESPKCASCPRGGI
ncbi:hypothetical protein DesfrDRAFT_2302 [Solidesulfovibrio fructosivorans JJ]]|uniref:Uncharacterized protein n=1 Tax=Solidesulfovibrio fructosivorans JJ] TaxID=596151 RepID=E1JXF3_SOLFR|nr:hypothetical protein [Solidesulfovibrio fructosivorans]EFL50930.1 hypothetical protein DesfrDRAFT_2302 [Solidesulfovibrio fructosivorans JJ]]